ncbi:hypothetical protein ACUL41_02225 [Virgibacillus natechei]|uniref:hypothetical protein n=1 Tax=Virgibacillus sp. CBA3643 TaxID=2942278 RepID=UPI0035A34CA2
MAMATLFCMCSMVSCMVYFLSDGAGPFEGESSRVDARLDRIYGVLDRFGVVLEFDVLSLELMLFSLKFKAFPLELAPPLPFQ